MSGKRAKEQRRQQAADQADPKVIRTIKVYVLDNGMVFVEGFSNNLHQALQHMYDGARAIAEQFTRSAMVGEVDMNLNIKKGLLVRPQNDIIIPH